MIASESSWLSITWRYQAYLTPQLYEDGSYRARTLLDPTYIFIWMFIFILYNNQNILINKYNVFQSIVNPPGTLSNIDAWGIWEPRDMVSKTDLSVRNLGI